MYIILSFVRDGLDSSVRSYYNKQNGSLSRRNSYQATGSKDEYEEEPRQNGAVNDMDDVSSLLACMHLEILVFIFLYV